MTSTVEDSDSDIFVSVPGCGGGILPKVPLGWFGGVTGRTLSVITAGFMGL